MEVIDEPGHTCGICKVTYATEVELEDHNWSLMHHIKIEKLKKGTPHSCNLCMESCANIIEYGKHLNDDRHKLALSRRAKEGTELLDSFAVQSDLLSKEQDIPPEFNRPVEQDYLEHMAHEFQGRRYQNFNGHRGSDLSANKHARSFSQPDMYIEKPPYLMDIDTSASQQRIRENVDPWLDWIEKDKAFSKHVWKNKEQIDNFKVPQGRPGHLRTNSDRRPNYHVAEREVVRNDISANQEQFFVDNFQDINWNDNSFYSEMHGDNSGFRNDRYHWHKDMRGENYRNNRARRGSFDSSRYNDNLRLSDMGRNDFQDDTYERGRGVFRKKRGAGRSHSYDNNSPESTSSSDSSLKRRLEIDDSIAPGKTRRRLAKDSNFSPSSTTNKTDISSSLINDEANQRPRSRSSSRDRHRGMDLEMFDTERPSSRNSDKRVSWSDQQQVTSTTGSSAQSPRGRAKTCKGKTSVRSKSPMVPDSSSESELSKTSNRTDTGKKKAGNVKAKTSPRLQRKNNISKDSTESVLEKAERLCKKLRNEREKAKQKKQTEEKKKKFEKQKEINDKIDTLSEKNKANITGVLDAEVAHFTSKEKQNEFLKADGTTEFLTTSGKQTAECSSEPELHRGQMIPEKLVNVPKPSSVSVAQDPVQTGNSTISITERIAQTRADIDSIRAKIESSVNSNIGSTNKAKEALLSPTRQLQSPAEQSSSQGKYSQPSDTNSLLKMVNSPRTTKERNQLAQMLREHAKSRKKLSLPRFNLKFSDLCSNSDRQDEQVNIEILAPSVQLEIANIIEADVKPDIAELERLLEHASAENAELDMNVLSDLGVSSPVRKAGSPVVTPSPLSFNVQTDSSLENTRGLHERISSPLNYMSPDRGRKVHGQNEISEFKQHKRHERSRSPVSNLFLGDQQGVRIGDKYRQERSEKGTGDFVGREVYAKDITNSGQGLNIEDLTVRLPRDKGSEKVENSKTGNTEFGSKNDHRFTSSLPMSSGRVGSSGNLSASVTLPSSAVRIKQEKPDDEYDKAVSNALSKAKAFFIKPAGNSGTEQYSRSGTLDAETSQGESFTSENLDLRQTDVNSGRFSPVRKSIHTQNLYRNDELPVRDSERYKTQQLEDGERTTLEKVTSILDGVPAPEVESGGDKSSSTTPNDNVPTYSQPKEKHLDSSQTSQASILEEVYSVSIQEESVRQEISSVDMKISKLKSLIEEASQELRRCSQEKEKLVEQESSYRTKRLQLLEESRSSSACSHSTPTAGLLGSLTQMQLENPVLLKFLMSQRQSDLSSVGGYSNVESGSQPDSERNPQRRGSFTSSISEAGPMPSVSQTNQESQLFSKSIEAVSGSSDTLTSVFLNAAGDKNVEEQRRSDGDLAHTRSQNDDNINSTNSISMLNKPLEHVGFVTLDALMRGDGDIGKLLNKSLESIEKGTIPEGASPLHKQTSNESRDSSAGHRERRDSTFSLDTGSDSERKSVSLKYMGTLPEGTDYESIVRQVSQENKNKNLMITVLSSPEAMSQFRRTPDAGSTPVVRPKEVHLALEAGYKSDGSSKTNSTHTLTHMSDLESHSARSTFSLGEQIKRFCDNQNVDVETQRAEKDGSALHSEKNEIKDTNVKFDGTPLSDLRTSPVKDCFVKLNKLESSERNSPKTVMHDFNSPVRKKLKSKKERDQMSRRKQKESFILQSDTNSEGENESRSSNKIHIPPRLTTKSDEDLVLSGSEDRTPRPVEAAELKRSRSLLDEVQLETETPSDSCEDRSASQTQSVVRYRGPSLSVAAVQEFKGDLYVCYNGCEVRRFDLKTGRILKELDCSQYLVNCLHVTSVDGRGDILYTGGTCKKLILFEPQKFSYMANIDYTERLMCLHENWGRLFVGLSNGEISVRSLKTDKELNCFSCTTTAVHSLGSSSAGMTKMLCLATGDKVIYVLDAITGLLITMLEGHTQPPRCLQVLGEKVISGGPDQALTIHSITTGELCKITMCTQTVTQIWCDSSTIYTANCDNTVRTYNFDLKPGELLKTSGNSIVTCGMVKDRMVIMGKRDGEVEGVQLDKLSKWTCKFGSCSLQFCVFSHLKLHVLSEHTSDKASHCTYKGCTYIFTKQDNRQEHVLSHLK